MITLDGERLTRDQLVAIAEARASVRLDPAALERAAAAARFVEDLVGRGRIVYGLSTGLGANANRLLAGPEQARVLQRKLLFSHAVGVGRPLPTPVVRALMALRVNTLLRGHSGIRPQTLEALVALLERGVHPIIPEKGSVGASGDLAPLSHMALVLLGAGRAEYRGEDLDGAEALARAGLEPVALSYKEGLALNNGTTLMAAYGTLALARLERLLKTADVAAALTLEAIAGRPEAFDARVHALRGQPGQIACAANLRRLFAGSTLVGLPFEMAPGEKTARPQDSYTLRCAPQVHGAVRDAAAQLARVLDVELNAVTDNPLLFPADDDVISAGNFHGMPIALALSYVKAAIPVLASIAERRVAKLVDACTNEGLPPFLVENPDGTDSGFMLVQYTAAALVNDLASRAMPASVYSVPTSANIEDHVSMGANEARHVWEMTFDLERVLALELLVAAQALDLRLERLQGRPLGKPGPDPVWQAHHAKVAAHGFRAGEGTEAARRAIREARFERPGGGTFSVEVVRADDVELRLYVDALIELVGRGDVVHAVERAVGPLA